MIATQAMDTKTKELSQEINRAEAPELSNLEEDILAFSKAKMELKKIYLDRPQK